MNIFIIAWRNIWRNKRRSLLSLLAIAAACALLMFFMAMQKGSYIDWINNTMRAHLGHLQVQFPGYLEDHDLSMKLENPGRVVELVESIPGVSACAPRINAPALVSREARTFGALLMGIDPARARGASTLDDVMRKGAYLADDDRDGILLSELLAKNLEAEVGDEITFLGQGADGSLAAGRLIVRGIFEFGIKDLDRTMAAAHIDTVGEAYGMGGAVSEVSAVLESDIDRPEVVAAAMAMLKEEGFDEAVVLGWPELLPGMEQMIKMDWNSGLIMYAVLVIVVGFGIANTFLMAFMERIHEYGVLLSLGMKRLYLGLMAYMESVLLLVVGLAVGISCGVAMTKYVGAKGWDFSKYEGMDEVFAEYGMSPVMYPYLCREAVVYSVTIVAVITLVMAVYPAVKASQLRPVEALRK